MIDPTPGQDFEFAGPRVIELTRGQVALVDADDYDRLQSMPWHASHRGMGKYYARSTLRENGRKRTVRMHRVILGAPHGYEVDHVNGDSLDNRKANLRLVTKAQNVHNSDKPSTSLQRFKGVRPRKNASAWEARMSQNGKTVTIGHFDTEQEAAAAYDSAVLAVRGSYARTNFKTAAERSAAVDAARPRLCKRCKGSIANRKRLAEFCCRSCRQKWDRADAKRRSSPVPADGYCHEWSARDA